MTAADDVNLDDLKRRARRRLVGAIVLALVVAVVVPMLLESDPKPLGEDVAVRIPPVDDGKFVNRLADKGKADAGKAVVRAEPPKADAGKADLAKAEPSKGEPAKAEAPRTEAPKAEAAVAPRAAEPASAPETPKADTPKAEPPRADGAKAEPAKADSAPAVAATPMPASGSSGVPGGDFAVQVYAFSDAYGANSLVNKLKRAGYPAYSEQASTAKGTLWRVRIGPYPSRENAASARDRLKGEGYNGIVTAK